MTKWIPADEVPEGEGRCYDIDGEHVAVCRHEGHWYAMSGECPTAEAGRRKKPLQEVIEGCPRREWRFDPVSGCCTFRPDAVGELAPMESQSRWWEAGGEDVVVEIRSPRR